jgi:hypothetical protein
MPQPDCCAATKGPPACPPAGPYLGCEVAPAPVAHEDTQDEVEPPAARSVGRRWPPHPASPPASPRLTPPHPPGDRHGAPATAPRSAHLSCVAVSRKPLLAICARARARLRSRVVVVGGWGGKAAGAPAVAVAAAVAEAPEAEAEGGGRPGSPPVLGGWLAAAGLAAGCTALEPTAGSRAHAGSRYSYLVRWEGTATMSQCVASVYVCNRNVSQVREQRAVSAACTRCRVAAGRAAHLLPSAALRASRLGGTRAAAQTRMPGGSERFRAAAAAAGSTAPSDPPASLRALASAAACSGERGDGDGGDDDGGGGDGGDGGASVLASGVVMAWRALEGTSSAHTLSEALTPLSVRLQRVQLACTDRRRTSRRRLVLLASGRWALGSRDSWTRTRAQH